MTSTAPVAVTPYRPGQDARLAFEGVAGQQVKLIVSDSAFDTGNFVASAIVSMLDSLETTVISQTVHAPGDEIDTNPRRTPGPIRSWLTRSRPGLRA